DQRFAIIALDTQPAEQQEAEPAEVVDQRGAPARAALAPGKDAGEIMQLAQLRRAFESLGFEHVFRSALARAKTPRRRQPLRQRASEKEGRISPCEQVGGDY